MPAFHSALLGNAVASTSKLPLKTQAVPSWRRQLSCSAVRRADHYQTLQLPKTATRQQIKAQFYRLSKEYHPDVRAGNETKFQAISEAYSILGNTDARRVYDNNLTSSSSSSYTHSTSQSASSPYYYQDIETGATRRARANYAWEHTRRTNPKYNRANPFASAYSDHQRQSAHEQFFDRMQAQQAWRQSNLSPGARRRMMEENEKIAREENLRNTSGLLRTLQVVGIFTAVLWMSGTFRASAWEADAGEQVQEDREADPAIASAMDLQELEGKDYSRMSSS